MRFLALVVALVLFWYGARGLSRVADQRVADLGEQLFRADWRHADPADLRKPWAWRHRLAYARSLALLALAVACLGVSVGLGPWWGIW